MSCEKLFGYKLLMVPESQEPLSEARLAHLPLSNRRSATTKYFALLVPGPSRGGAQSQRLVTRIAAIIPLALKLHPYPDIGMRMSQVSVKSPGFMFDGDGRRHYKSDRDQRGKSKETFQFTRCSVRNSSDRVTKGRRTTKDGQPTKSLKRPLNWGKDENADWHPICNGRLCSQKAHTGETT